MEHVVFPDSLRPGLAVVGVLIALVGECNFPGVIVGVDLERNDA